MECGPAASDESLKVAVPLPLRTPLPNFVVPSMKSTFPVGRPAPGNDAATVAVKVTDCPKVDSFGAAVKLVAVLAWLTTCVTAEVNVLPE